MAINIDGLKEYIGQMPMVSAEEREYLLNAINRSVEIDNMRIELERRQNPDDHAIRNCLDIIDFNAEMKR